MEKNRRNSIYSDGGNVTRSQITPFISLEALTTTSKENPNDLVAERLDRLVSIYTQLNGDISENEQNEMKQGIQPFGLSSHLSAQQMIFDSIQKVFQQYAATDQKINDLIEEYKTKSKFTPSTTIDQYEVLIAEYQRAIKSDIDNLRSSISSVSTKLDIIIGICQRYEKMQYENSVTINKDESKAELYMKLLNDASKGEITLSSIEAARQQARSSYINEKYQKQVLQNWKKQLPKVSELEEKFDIIQKKQSKFVYMYRVRQSIKSEQEKIN